MIKITPSEMMSIISAAKWEMQKHAKDYNRSLPKVNEIYKWLISINWDEPYKDSIMIDELPF